MRFVCIEAIVRSGVRWLALFVLALALPACGNGGNSASGGGSVPPSPEIIAASSTIDWSLAGAKTDFAARTIICATLSPSPSGENDTTQINNAIAACPAGQVVKLAAGTFTLNSAIIWGNHSNVTLRGSGPKATILQGQSGFPDDSILDFSTGRDPDSDWTLTPAITLSGGLTKDSSQITTSGAHGWVAGDYVLIDQVNTGTGGNPPFTMLNGATWLSRANGTRLQAQMVKITSVVNATTVNISPPLYFTYTAGQSPQGKKANVKLEGISVESLGINNHTSKAAKMINIYNLFDSLFYNLDLDGIPSGSQSRHFHIFNSLWLTIKHSELRGGEGNATDQGYGLFHGFATSANLVEDNVFHEVILASASEGATTGNVLAYNYTFGSLWYDSSNRLMIINHGGGSMNLIEGNIIEGRYREDSYFGSGHYNTVLRNRIEQMKTNTQTGQPIDGQEQTFDLEQYHWYTAAVGNVLGTSGYETVYEHNGVNGALDTIKLIYRLGYTDLYDSDAAGNDAGVGNTIVRHGNWDSVNQAVIWDPSISNRVIPNSFYLKSKPAFFGDCAWPWNGPDLTPMTQTLPAKARYDGTPSC